MQIMNYFWFLDCLKYATRGRHYILLQWSWTIPFWHSSLHCRELLHFWLVGNHLVLSCFIINEMKILLFNDIFCVYKGKKVFARGSSKENWNIFIHSLAFGFPSYTHVLSFGHCEKTDADEGHTLQDSFGSHLR